MGFSVIGKRIPRIDGKDKLTGMAKYTCDIKPEGTLFGKILRSPYPHAKIINIDDSKARKVNGVKDIITGNNVPQTKYGLMIPDWNILPNDKVRFVGEEVAVVAAIDKDAALEAIDLIEVEYEKLPAVFDPEIAMSEGAPLIYDDKERNIVSIFEIEQGEVDNAFSQSDIIFEETYTTSQVYQAYMETMGCLAKPEDYNRLTMWISTQVASMSRLNYSKALNMNPEDIRIIKPHVGGAFGGKFEYKSHILAAVLARRTGLPVSLINSREEDFAAGNPRVPMKIWIKMGLKNDGTFLAKDVKIIAGNGGRTVYGPAITSTACYRIDSLYKFRNVRAVGYTVYTNTIPTSAFRGFGNAQMHFALESAIDSICSQNNLDPVEVRKLNGATPGYVSVHGWEIKSAGLKECLDETAKASGYYNRKNESNKSKKRGMGVAACMHVSGNRPFIKAFDGSSALVRLTPEGRAIIYTGEAELGQGLNTVFAQIVAEVVGLRIENVRTAHIDTDISPFGLGSFATRATTIGGRAVYEAAVNLKVQLLTHISKAFNVSKEDLSIKDGQVCFERKGTKEEIYDVMQKVSSMLGGTSLVGHGIYVPDTVIPNEKKYGNIAPAYPFGCHVAEVEVDTETGDVRVINYWAAHDVGRALNMQSLEGQVEGGVIMGLGWALTEDMIIQDGKLLNPNFHDYHIPTAMDYPDGRIHSIFIESKDPNGPFGAKGIGEPTLIPVAAAVANAIYDAVGVRIKSLPITPEKILERLEQNIL